MIGMVGLMDDCARNAGSGFAAAGDRIALIGGIGTGHLGGSEYLRAVHGKTAGIPPPLDLAREKAVQRAVRVCVRKGAVRAAHDCSDGGIAVALAEMCFARDLGCRVKLPGKLRPDALLFGEDASRILVSYAPAQAERVRALCAQVPFEEIGEVRGATFSIEGILEARIAELREPWSRAIPRLVGETVHTVALEGHAGAP
jgi:phosphoribosylformylglycinamidine synthase